MHVSVVYACAFVLILVHQLSSTQRQGQPHCAQVVFLIISREELLERNKPELELASCVAVFEATS